MTKRGKTVRRGRGRGRTQRRGRTQKRGRTQRRRRTYRQRGGVEPRLEPVKYYGTNYYGDRYTERLKVVEAEKQAAAAEAAVKEAAAAKEAEMAAAAAAAKETAAAVEAGAKKYFQDVEVYGKNMLEEYNSLIASGLLSSENAYDAIILRMTREIPEKEYEKLITSRNKGDMTPFRKLKEEMTIKDLNRIEREQMIARRAAAEAEAAERERLRLMAAEAAKAKYFDNEVKKYLVSLPMDERPAFMQQYNVLKQELNSSEVAFNKMMLRRYEPTNTKDEHEYQAKAIQFISRLPTLERPAFTQKYNGNKKKLGSSKAAFEATMQGYGYDMQGDDMQGDANDSIYQHYAPNNTPPSSTSMSYEEWKQTQ